MSTDARNQSAGRAAWPAARAVIGTLATACMVSLLAGGTDTVNPAKILLNDAMRFAGPATLHAVLTHMAPRTFGPSLALRLA